MSDRTIQCILNEDKSGVVFQLQKYKRKEMEDQTKFTKWLAREAQLSQRHEEM